MGPIVRLCFVLGIVACGQVPDGHYRGDPIFQVRGLAKLKDQTTALEVLRPRAALIWFGAPSPMVPDPTEAVCPPGERSLAFGAGSAASIASEVGLVSSFPASFTVDVYGPPAAESMGDAQLYWANDGLQLPAGARIAEAWITVYDDLNDNHELDLLAPDAQGPIDRILSIPVEGSGGDLGSYHDYSVLYIDCGGAQCPPLQGGLQQGFNVVKWSYPTITDPNAPWETFQLLAADEPIVAQLAADLAQNLACRISPAGYFCIQDLGAVPLDQMPAGSHVFCSPDGRSLKFSHRDQSTRDSLCATLHAHFTHGDVNLAAGDPTPPGWPCPMP